MIVSTNGRVDANVESRWRRFSAPSRDIIASKRIGWGAVPR